MTLFAPPATARRFQRQVGRRGLAPEGPTGLIEVIAVIGVWQQVEALDTGNRDRGIGVLPSQHARHLRQFFVGAQGCQETGQDLVAFTRTNRVDPGEGAQQLCAHLTMTIGIAEKNQRRLRQRLQPAGDGEAGAGLLAGGTEPDDRRCESLDLGDASVDECGGAGAELQEQGK